MDFLNHCAGDIGDDQEASYSRKGKKAYHRHTARQIHQLETFFRECPHPDDNQRRQLSRELNLEPKQIKFWFQNKRTQTKAQHERADNSVLRAENERIQVENLAIKEALKNVICPSCGGPPFGEQEREQSLRKLHLENAQLKEELEKVSNIIAKFVGKPISQIEPSIPVCGSSMDSLPAYLPIHCMGSPALELELGSEILAMMPMPYQFEGVSEMEKALMSETAATAMNELIRLVRIEEPLWVKTSTSNGRYVIHRESYEKIFPRSSHFKSSSCRVESSKDSGMILNTNGASLVEMFLDPNKWVDLFPSIVTNARVLQILETGTSGNRDGSLQLMYEQMHILSPLVPPREFCILRHCRQIEHEVWVIVDVSYNCLKENIPPCRSWRLPSGCVLQDMPNGHCKVTWVEHVEVDDKTQTHRLYRDLICGSSAYGAERWIITLQRMCERISIAAGETSPTRELGVVTTSPECRRSVAVLAHRIVKNFFATLSMSGKLGFPQLSEVNNSGIRVSVRKSTDPAGMVVGAATSLWLPLQHEDVFNFFTDKKTRFEWDVLTNGNTVDEIAHISTNRAYPGNFISVLRLFVTSENNMMILQECCTDPLGSFVIYAPLDISTMSRVMSGEDPSFVSILPSGFVISRDGRPYARDGASTVANAGRSSGGSLLTVSYQILASSCSSKELNMDSVASVNTLISSCVQKIKVALNCSNLD